MLVWLTVLAGLSVGRAAIPLTTLEYRIVGTQLRVSPAVLSVPKGVPGSVLVELIGSASSAGTAAAGEQGAFVEATLRGPSFPARRVVGAINQALLLPPLSLVGDYQLDNIRLVDAATGSTRLEGSPANVPVKVFDEVLVSRVTSRPLTLDEIKERGIVIDEQNFRAIEFEVGFVLDGKTIPVRFPVVAPTFNQTTEIIPAAELEKRLAEAEAINRDIAGAIELPPELEAARLNIDIQGINFQFVDPSDEDLALQVPPIPALMVVPGRIGLLHQFFSVQVFTENAAPEDSGLSVNNVRAELILPPGPDLVASTNYNAPGDDPLRFARIGPDKIIQPIQPVVRPGADGKINTSDDITRLFSGEGGQGEFLVEGLQEGLHVMNLKLTADLDGLAAGTVKITGKAAGSVLVRNPKFSLAFSHPRTVRAGEPYDVYVTIMNISSVPANLVNVTLNRNSISGGVLESEETVQLETISPGQTATARFRVRSQRTGAISFSNLTTSDDSLVGRFRLRGGFDERGVALSPDTIGMPDFVNALPTNRVTGQGLLDAANRVLGQALSIATAPQLPPGVKNVTRSIVTRRVLELAEAGQRLRYHDETNRVLVDLLFDWQGGRIFNEGFDQIIKETDAGREWREAVARFLEIADSLDAATRLVNSAADIAGRGEAWAIFSLDRENGTVRFGEGINGRVPETGGSKAGANYRDGSGSNGVWSVARPSTNLVVEWFLSNAVARAQLALLVTGTNGTANLFRWTVENLAVGACVRLGSLGESPDPPILSIDSNCDGTPDSTLAAMVTPITESPPRLISVIQDITVLSGRPPKPCPLPGVGNYATVVAVLFSKSMTQAEINVPSAYTLENGNSAQSVQVQPGGRVALLNMRQPVGAIRARTMTISGVTDPRGNTITSASARVETDFDAGVALRGLVVRSDGTPAPGVPVTLTMYDEVDSGFAGCSPFIVRVSQVFTKTNGAFSFDFVLGGIPYSVSATDTSSLTPEALALILESAAGDTFNRQKLLELANSPGAQNTLLDAFAVGALPQAIAKAEGLDRALLRDLIPTGSPREGTEVPVALRFRGRATVEGQVLASDGTTPVQNAAVNLFPDPDSRELGRGIFSDSNGRFAFFGVPLGIFSIEARNSAGLARTVSGVLDQPGQTTNITVVLSQNAAPRTGVAGRVFEADNATPHAQPTVLIGRFVDGKFQNVVAVVRGDSSGFWQADNIPANIYDLVALSFDGKRRGVRGDITAPTGVTNQITIALQGRSVVVGRVETSTGAPVPNALVAGGDALVRTDSNGVFRLTGVPTGLQRQISAALERNPAAGIDFHRLGSASVDVFAGIDNFAVIRLQPAGRIVGRVLDEQGRPVPNVNVALPEQGGFRWVKADANGNYKFEPLELKKHTLSAPAPPVAENDVAPILNTLANKGASQDELLAAIGEAFAIFTGAGDPLLNGEGATFNPLAWGFTETTLSFDGQTAVADIRFLSAGTISGSVINGQGVPIGARVRLTGIGPARNGQPSTIIRGERNSDPALGTFEFPGQALVGDWGLQAASPFFPQVLSTSGKTSPENPNATNIVLQFPATRDINGRLAGFVLNPDGSPASSNVNVKISFGNDFVIRTGSNGLFDTQIALPALDSEGRPGRGYSIEADDPATGLRGQTVVTVLPGITNFATVRLLGRGALVVTVLQADGSRAAGARVDLEQGSFPRERFQGTNDASGRIHFGNLFEGSYAVCADFVSGPTRIFGRASVSVQRGVTNEITVHLSPTATIRGRFVKRDLVTPVPFAQVAVGVIGFTTTDTNGVFEVRGVPLGSHRLSSQDPVSGIGATLAVTLTVNGEVREVQLVEQSRGEIVGAVVNSYGTGVVAGAIVKLRTRDGLAPERVVSTGPDGRFNFPGTGTGPFDIEADDPATGLKGRNSATLPENASQFDINVQLQPLATLAGTVFRPDGVTPASNSTVRLPAGNSAFTADTDANGRVSFRDLPLMSYTLRASSKTLSESRSAIETNISLTAAGAAPEFRVTLRGVGAVEGIVFRSDGLTPAPGATVTLRMQSPFVTDEVTTLANGSGRYRVENVAVGAYRVSAIAEALGASVNGEISADGETDTVNLRLGASGSVTGQLVRADGLTEVPALDVLLTFSSQSGLLGRAFVRTDSGGNFLFQNIPVGAFDLEAIAPAFNGIARLTSLLSSNAQTLNLGAVRLDEDDPRVVNVSPPNTAVGVPINITVDLLFNEPLATNSLNTNGVYLRSVSAGTPRINLQLLPDTNGVLRLVRLTPQTPLLSEQTYEVIVIDGERKDALGGVIATGPRDLVGRPLTAPFISSFTTADQDPPDLVSISPTNGAIQVDPRSVMRLSFNEPIRDTGFVFTVTGPGGPVSGAVSVGLNNLVLVFTPTAALQVNAAYTATISGVRDLAGNAAAGGPFTSVFSTLDTLGPDIAALRLFNNASPIASGTVQVEALLATNEPGVVVRFTQDLNPIGSDSVAPFRLDATLPASGSTTFRAIATDRFGNDGPLAELTVAVVSNQPPVVLLTRGTPTNGPVLSGRSFTLLLSATDDSSVSNITLTSTGALVTNLTFSGGVAREVPFVLPSVAVAGETLIFRAQAVDAPGLTSTEVTLPLEIRDGTPPIITIFSPASNALLNTSQPLALLVGVTDNSSNVTLRVTISGGLTTTQTVSLALAPNVTATNLFSIPLTNAPRDGTTLTATVRAEDAAGNVATNSRSFVLPDSSSPRLVSSSPTNGSLRQSLWLRTVSVNMNEALAPATVNTNSVLLERGSNQPVGRVVRLSQDGRTILVEPAVPLQPGQTYTIRLLPAITDPTGNPLADAAGNPAPPTGLAFSFITADLLAVSPTNGAPVIPGQSVPVNIRVEPGFGANFWRFIVNSNPPVQVTIQANATNVAANLPTSTNDLTATIHIAASDSSDFTHALFLPDILLDVRAPSGDGDGDGLPDNYEVAHGLDPFRNDAGEDPDSDGLTNLAEFQQGTHPRLNDTDGDGITDAVDPNPLVANQRPVAVPSLVTNADGTVTITLGSSDPDGDALTTRLTALPAIGRIFTTTNGTTLSDAITDVPTVVTGSPPQVIYRPLGVTSTNQLRYLVNDAFTNSAEAIITLVSTNNPASDVDGDTMPDGYEVANGLEPFTDDRALDRDGDTLSNLQEFNLGTKPNRRDTDVDGLNDNQEIALGTLPLDPDTDDDGILDGFDPNPFTPNADFDGDGVADADDPDIDGDDLLNTDELARGTDARKPDTDGDRWRDGVEAGAGSDPLVAASVPVLFHIAEPEVSLILPTLIPSGDVTNGITIGQPEVGLILPAFAEFADLANGLTVAQPEVGLILPALAEFAEITNGLTVAQPEVGLILPAFVQSFEVSDGLTVAQPEVGLILPVSPDLDPAALGPTVAEPVVLLRLDAAAGAAGPASMPGGTNTSGSSGVVLRLVQVQGAPNVAAEDLRRTKPAEGGWHVVLQWNGPANGTYIVEASSDLHTWAPVPMEILSSANGIFRVRCEMMAPLSTFYRLRHVP